MQRTFGRSIAALGFAGLMSFPVMAQGIRIDAPLPGLEIRIGHKAPPRLRSERRPPRPGRDYTWLRGSWDWQGNDWAWVPGRWDRPGERGARWVPARYAREGSVWRYEPGHWSNQRVVEGEDYRQWKAEHGKDRGKDHHDNRNHDKDRDRDNR